MKAFCKKHKKGLIILGVIIAIIVAAVFYVRAQMKKAMDMLNTMTQTEMAVVEYRTLMDTVSATGTIVSADTMTVKADVQGVKVLTLNVEVGDVIEEGDLIATFDTEDLEYNLSVAQKSLSVSQEQSDLSMSQAQRYLKEAEASRDLNVERADADAAKAWNDYLKSVTDMQTAEDEYEKAKKNTIEKKGELEYREKLLEEAGGTVPANIGAAGGIGGNYGPTQEALEENFATELADLSGYITNEGLVISPGFSELYIAHDPTTFPQNASAIIDTTKSAVDTTQEAAINGYIRNLANYNYQYVVVLIPEAQAAAAQAAISAQTAEITQLTQEVATWQAKYNAAVSEEAAKKAAFEAAVKTSQSMLDAYNMRVRAVQDASINGDSNVATSNDAVTSSELTAELSGQNERNQIRTIEKQIEACTVYAPASGVVTAVNIAEGDTYAGTPILTIEDVSTYEIKSEIDEYDIAKIKEGQKIVFKTNGTGDEEYTGEVTQIAPRATASASGSVTYTVRMSMDKVDPAFKMDMTAKISIILESKEHCLTVPYNAVQEDEDGKYYVEVPDENDDNTAVESTDAATDLSDPQKTLESAGLVPTSKKIYVTKGIESDYYIEIIGSDVTEGMEVIVPKGDVMSSLEQMMTEMGAMGGF